MSNAPGGPNFGSPAGARLNFALAAGRLGYWELDLKTRELFNSDIYKENWGRAPADTFTYETLLQSIHPADRDEHERAVEAAVATGKALDVEYRVIWPNGSVHWLQVRGHAVYDKRGRPLRMAGISLDITDRKHTEESLREETRTLELLNLTGAALAGDLDLRRVTQTVTDAATELSGAQFGALFYNVIDDQGGRHTHYTVSGTPREALERFPMPRNAEAFLPIFGGQGIVRSDDIRNDPRYAETELNAAEPDGGPKVASYLAVPVISRSGTVLGGLFFGHERPGVFTERAERIVKGIASQAAIAIDNAQLFRSAQIEIEERMRVEKRQALLLAELNHRVKNTLAIVQSIATQTLRHADSPEAFRAGFEARVMALAEAHNLLTDSNWAGASLRDIVDRVLLPYAGDERPRYHIPQADVRVGPKTAVSLVMAFHELATNAAKYGALSTSAGTVKIDWTVVTETTPPRLVMSWTETGGPAVSEPTRKGFGSRLIRGLAHETSGHVQMEFARTGLVCRFDIPLFAEGQ